MTNRNSRDSHIRAIGDDAGDAAEPSAPAYMVQEDESQEIALSWDESDDRSVQGRRVLPMVLATFALLVVAAWSAFFIWTNAAEMSAKADADRWIGWLTQWSLPVLLIAVAWLIGMRSSAREASRFGDAARVLSQESALLETRLVAVNRELSLAREFLAAQSRELDYLGRSAAERISEHAASLQSLVVQNGAQVDAIAGVSVTALENMAQLRDNLPVIANSARDVTNQIGGAGRTAKAQLGDLISGFERLNEFGQASERQVTSLRERIDVTLEELSAFAESMDANNAARFDALTAHGEILRRDLEAREDEVLGAMRQRGEALKAELVAAHDARQLEEAAALAAMRGRISSFTREAHDAAAAVRAGERAALETWEAQVAALRTRLEDALQEVASLDEQFLDKARQKLASLTQEAEAVDARLTERDRGFADRVAKRRAELEEVEAVAFARLSQQAAAFDAELTQRHDTLAAQADGVGQRAEAMAVRIGEIEAHAARVVAHSGEAERTLAAGSERFAEIVRTNAQELGATETALARLTDTSVRLLELIQAASSHSRRELPAAIEGFEQQLDAARAVSGDIRDALVDARAIGSEMTGSLAGLRGEGHAALTDIDAIRSRLGDTLAEQEAALTALREQLMAAEGQTRGLTASVAQDLGAAIDDLERRGRDSLTGLQSGQVAALASLQESLAALGGEQRDRADEVATALEQAVAQLRTASTAALRDLEDEQGTRVTALAERIGEESAQAIDRAIEARTGEAVAKLDAATARSAEVSREAVAGLRDQLARLHELTVNLETRAARARDQVEEQVDNDFARRMALISESLNSHSIDIAKALSTEVTDTAWASYLKGDRGVFTRRAVKLIDGGEAREISALYENDHEFRDHVSRYIHDFEAMLRTMLSTRDGHALGVTLLSSDMGKLYVALAQAIQRLRQ